MDSFFEDIELDKYIDLLVDESDYNRDDSCLIIKIVQGNVIPDNGLVYDKHRRYYVENLTKRDFSLENTTPYQIFLCDTVIKERSWGILLKKVTLLLLDKYPAIQSALPSFRCKWSKQEMFSFIKKTNFIALKEDMFINVNHTALHSCWLLQDLLEFCKINVEKVKFLIHRPPGSEQQEIKELIRASFIKGLAEYIIDDLRKNEEYANKIVFLVDKYINPLIKSISKSYNDLFLFDSYLIMLNYTKKLKEKILKSSYSDKAKRAFNSCIEILVSYYKKEKY